MLSGILVVWSVNCGLLWCCFFPTAAVPVNCGLRPCPGRPGGTEWWASCVLWAWVTSCCSSSASSQPWPTSTMRRSSRKETNSLRASSSRTVNCENDSWKKWEGRRRRAELNSSCLNLSPVMRDFAGMSLVWCLMVWPLGSAVRLGASLCTAASSMVTTSTPWVWC